MFTKEEAITNISMLVERFHEQIASYKKMNTMKRSHGRILLTLFLKALGLDVDIFDKQ